MTSRGTCAVLFLGLAVVETGCAKPPKLLPSAATASAAPIGSASATPPLLGQYRVDAMIALNDKARKALGGERISMKEAICKSDPDACVFARWSLKFAANLITVRSDMIFRLESSYHWAWCHGEGSALWEGSVMTLPGGVATQAAGGSFTRSSSSHSSCEAELVAGAYALRLEDGETRLYIAHDGNEGALVIVKDDSDPDVESRARELAGYKADK